MNQKALTASIGERVALKPVQSKDDVAAWVAMGADMIGKMDAECARLRSEHEDLGVKIDRLKEQRVEKHAELVAASKRVSSLRSVIGVEAPVAVIDDRAPIPPMLSGTRLHRVLAALAEQSEPSYEWIIRRCPGDDGKEERSGVSGALSQLRNMALVERTGPRCYSVNERGRRALVQIIKRDTEK